ncbi:CaiB/BaiF CoA transferase family protein [Fusibacter ferrireducens]|uniref:CoA transferase n=1 Tax=Fusibacter ferrireducens TaxID=2785058 RepID=A0ABR9ZX59_9FIRM|nr:CaiB/BaiF CoA-transferase family protein [Fusibacter ferrireducens]MBF4695053.1 CoA transferase [Fusibacter ferrireducens]
MAKQALEGLKVVEVGNILAGPWCGTMMADFGAEVIKVEPPVQGDLIRNMGRIKDLWYCVEGRNKKNITLNLKSERGKTLLIELLKDADILIENFRPGVFERMGFTWERLQEINPRLVYVCSSGYGQTGPNAKKPGFDRIGLALGGFLEVTGEADGAPIKPGISAADFYTALFACVGAMFAIYNRDVVGSGRGQRVDCCLTESVLRLQESIIAEYSYDGSIRTRIGNGTFVTIPSGHFLTADDKWIVLSVSGDKLFHKWAEIVGRTDMIEDDKYNTPEGRQCNREEINQIAEAWIKQHTADECLEKFGSEIPCAKVYNVEDILKDPHFKARDAIVDVATENFGTLKMQNATPKMSATPGEIKWAGAPIGKFTDEILKERLGLSDSEVEVLQQEGVI